MTVNITKDEARTLIWALQIVNAQETKRLLKKGIKPNEHRTIKNLCSVSRNVNAVLVKSEY